MRSTEPTAKLDGRYSSQGAAATEWAEGRKSLQEAPVFWISTVRPDSRPHVTPLIAVWMDDALYFCTGAGERKAKNLERNARCILTTGCNAFDRGLDVVVEGEAARVSDDARLRRIAEAYVAKYGPDWRFGVRDGHFVHQGVHEGAEPVLVFEVAPVTAFGFRKGEEFSQTRWRF
jgi:nitroimidazol reductase NimA-like FMN-containing flavoprotein (pyridoxamine 5'-phosphate oxidase superfamily)